MQTSGTDLLSCPDVNASARVPGGPRHWAQLPALRVAQTAQLVDMVCHVSRFDRPIDLVDRTTSSAAAMV